MSKLLFCDSSSGLLLRIAKLFIWVAWYKQGLVRVLNFNMEALTARWIAILHLSASLSYFSIRTNEQPLRLLQKVSSFLSRWCSYHLIWSGLAQVCPLPSWQSLRSFMTCENLVCLIVPSITLNAHLILLCTYSWYSYASETVIL